MNIVIPMAGLGSRFSNAGYEKPKPFIDVLGKPMIVRVIENLSYLNAKFILIARKEHMIVEAELIKEIEENYNAVFVSIDKVTEGAVCTVLHARRYINNETPLLLANSDQIVDFELSKYVEDCRSREADGSILTFIDKEKSPKWSFAKVDQDGWVSQVKEKEVISDYATVGLYYFSKGKDFVDYALDMIVDNERTNNEFYTCPVYNYAIKDSKKICIYNINFEDMHGIGTPDDLNKYLALKR
jgi:UDP-N-acetylglucosamine diphosphorylase / glucose-1-phosphate thymidylyltransferase / UDP-N-acetylgalactosamine diphosphorylase / glucosamine-1-phosphate N-acetyltransferase / galactosamine-1-phosphate N-acetyltransferase